jgi:protein SCO1/2
MRWNKLLLVVILILFPCLGYILLQSGKNHFVTLPYLGPSEVVESIIDGEVISDTLYHKIPDFSFINQLGDTVTQDDFKGKIYVADFFFVSCPTICKEMVKNMGKIQKEFSSRQQVKLISHTVNPEADSVSVLKEYGEKHEANPNQWSLVTGKKKDIYQIAREGYMVNALVGDGGPSDFIHTELFALIDYDGHIRSFHDGTTKDGVDNIMDEIKLLMLEKLRKEENR